MGAERAGRRPGISPFESLTQVNVAGARTWAFTPGAGSLGEALLEETGNAEADLRVMGAYGHSRLREMVLGGVTRSVLSDADIPVFLMH